MSRSGSLAMKLGRAGLAVVIALFTQVILYFVGEAILLHGDSPRTFMVMAVAVTPDGGIVIFVLLVLVWYGILTSVSRLSR
jgi:hypothetical protein